MAKNTNVLVGLLLGILVTSFVGYLFMPQIIDWYSGVNGDDVPDGEFSQNAKFLVGVTNWANETSTDALTGGILYVYDSSYNLKESLAVSSRTFTSALYYKSGDTIQYKLVIPSFETISGEVVIPYYDSAEIISYHVLDNLIVSRNPQTALSFSINGVYNTSAWIEYDVSVSGNTMEIIIEIRNNRDETRLFNFEDQTYNYRPLVVVENLYFNATANPLDVRITGLELVRAETSTQTGLYIYTPTEDSLNRNRNQAAGTLAENNRISVTFEVDVSQIGSGEMGFLRFQVFDDTDLDYYRTYGNTLASAITMLSNNIFCVAVNP